MKIHQLILPLALACSGIANAATYSCTGKVINVTTSPDGNLNASFDFASGGVMMWQAMCSFRTPADSTTEVPGHVCKTIAATLLTAKTADRPIMMWFDNNDQTCSAPAWGPLRSRGWYWGPSIQ